ncbi:MAG: DUF2804 domain-containing protein [Candidatus Hydrogenedens sp.]|nr:DUF2804 domain-containing protein [Candidatus Hydrogenedens sp.]
MSLQQVTSHSKIPLCLPNGCLNKEAIRWDSYPFVDAKLYKDWGRKKQWMYWAVVSPDGVFATVIADADYMKIGSVYLAMFNKNNPIEKASIQFTKQQIHIPPNPYEEAYFKHKNMWLEYRIEQGSTNLYARTHIHGQEFIANIEIFRDMDFPTLNVVIPWTERRFQFTSKQLPFPARGKVRYKDMVLEFNEKDTFACLDYGSGKWKYKTDWNWSAGYGIDTQGRKVAINLGAQWTDGTGQNENGLWIDNQFFKIHEEVTFIWDKKEPLHPWHIRSKTSDDIDLTFSPFHIRPDKTNLILLKSEVVQCFGTFCGKIKLGNENIEIISLIGWAEEHHAYW